MSNSRGTRYFGLAILVGALTIAGCQAIKDATNALNSFKKLQFSLGDVHAFKVADVDISGLKSPSSISVLDGAKLVKAYSSNTLPVTFTLDVLAKNPNDGSGSSKGADLYITKLAWTLHIDDKPTINGVVNDRLKVPATGQTTVIPVTMGLDLVKFFGEKGYEDLINLAFAIGGVSGTSSRLKVTANATVDTPVGEVTYPDELTIVNASFTNP